ncbi:hypothetical protein E1A91_D08G149900v1 [Gossypium mustelinum]|uniref:Peroxin-3 n=1 Tax=Gossypium mustelinum TaxID=34275 RepID=A0A5D2TVP9_GOSMU|nr:hypothetical protein E1A91_D08G149900v1 [Gossypium mustelinum]TYI69361.1 hypothetical protein E1A91_D08G149900v1 [Gossypium mustelinum]
MLYLRDLWRRHRRKVLVTAGVLGSGYLLYKLYDAHKRRLTDLERQLANERENDEFIKAQMQLHFENIQRIADTTTLPHAMPHLSCQIAEDLNLSHLMERLVKEKDQPNSLSSLEKLELWDSLKILSFTRMVVSIWAVTILSLYIRVQVNILGRYLYIDIARGLGSSYLLVNEFKSIEKLKIFNTNNLRSMESRFLNWKLQLVQQLGYKIVPIMVMMY